MKNQMYEHGRRILRDKENQSRGFRGDQVAGKDPSLNGQYNPDPTAKLPAEGVGCPVLEALEYGRANDVTKFIHRRKCPTCQALAKEREQKRHGVEQLRLFDKST